MLLDDSNICLICLEYSIGDQVSKDFTVYVYKICDCRYKVHQDCIARWIDYKSTCLLCNRKIIYKEPVFARIKRTLYSIMCSSHTYVFFIICIQRLVCYLWLFFIVRIIIFYGELREKNNNMPHSHHIGSIENQHDTFENITN